MVMPGCTSVRRTATSMSSRKILAFRGRIRKRPRALFKFHNVPINTENVVKKKTPRATCVRLPISPRQARQSTALADGKPAPPERLRGRRCGGDGMTTTRLRASEANDRLTVALINAASQRLRPHCSDAGSWLWLSDDPADRAEAAAYAKAVRCSIPATRSGNSNVSVSGRVDADQRAC